MREAETGSRRSARKRTGLPPSGPRANGRRRERAASERAEAERAEAEKRAAEQRAAEEKARAALNPPGRPTRSIWSPPPRTSPASPAPTAAETTGPVPAVPGSGRETVRSSWSPPTPRRRSALAVSAAGVAAVARAVPAAQEQPSPARDADPFADLPRITPFTDFELDPVDSRPAPTPDGYTGRRRAAAEESVAAHDDAAAGRHSQGGAAPADTGTGRRSRHAEDNTEANELLARLLARESAQR